MAYIRITEINEGHDCVIKFADIVELDWEYAYNVGLTKYHSLLGNIRKGKAYVVPTKMLDEIRAAGKGVFEFEVEHPKYANQHVGSDVYPYEIIEWKTESRIVLREMDTADYTGCYDGHCKTYISNPKNPTFEVREHKNGGFYDAGTRHCPYILSEEPYYYRDPSF